METVKKWWWGLVRFGYRLLYYELAWSYDLVSYVVSLGEWRQWQLSSLDFLPPTAAGSATRLLELGHGPGHMLTTCAERGYRVTGCDLSPFMGRLAQARIEKKGLGLQAAVVQGAIPDLPFGERSFDCILSQFPTPYILEVETAAAIVRLLKPGGCLVIVPEGHIRGSTPLHRLIAWLFLISGQVQRGVDPTRGQDLLDYWRRWSKNFSEAGLVVDVFQPRRPRSACTVIVAIKPPSKTQ